MRAKNLTDVERLAVLEELRLSRYYRVLNIAKRFGITRDAIYMLESRERKRKHTPPKRGWLTALADCEEKRVAF